MYNPNAQKGVKKRNILEEMGHKQPPTPVHTDNLMADSIVNFHVQPKCTKAMDMRHQSKTIPILLVPGGRAEYWTKHDPPSHHCQMQSEILTPYDVVLNLQKKMGKIQ